MPRLGSAQESTNFKKMHSSLCMCNEESRTTQLRPSGNYKYPAKPTVISLLWLLSPLPFPFISLYTSYLCSFSLAHLNSASNFIHSLFTRTNPYPPTITFVTNTQSVFILLSHYLNATCFILKSKELHDLFYQIYSLGWCLIISRSLVTTVIKLSA